MGDLVKGYNRDQGIVRNDLIHGSFPAQDTARASFKGSKWSPPKVEPQKGYGDYVGDIDLEQLRKDSGYYSKEQ